MREERIGILGGGVAGLSMAYYLERAGYARVTVLEASSRPGGQCSSHPVGGREFDVGAIFADGSYSRVFALLDELGLDRGPRTGGFLRVEQGEQSPPLGGPAVLEPIEAKMSGIDLETGYRPLSDPGFRGLHPDLHLPFDEFVAKHGLEDLKRLLLPFWTGFGYGFFADSPTAYVLKYMNPAARRACFGTGEVYFLETGFSGLCEALAGRVPVRTNFNVCRIQHKAPADFLVSSDTGDEEVFDRLVVCFDPSRLPSLMDCARELTQLLSTVETYPYSVAVMTVEDWSDRSLIMIDNLAADRQGHIQIAVRRYRDEPVYILYSLSSGIPEAEVLERFCSDIEAQGGRPSTVHFHRRWNYFQHVSAGVLAAGFYDQLEDRQGEGGLYFAGQLMNHSSVERVIEYSADLVERFF